MARFRSPLDAIDREASYMSKTRTAFRLLIVLAILLAGFLIYRSLSQYTMAEITASLGEIPAIRLATALGLAAASYLCLTGFDWLGLRYAGKPLAWRRAALASFVSLSIGHTVGIAALSSGAVRYRFYTRWGLDAGDVAKVILFAAMTVGLGLATLGGFGLLLYRRHAEALLGFGPAALSLLAVLCLALPALYLLLSIFMRGQMRIRRWTVEVPELRLALPQILIGATNFACVAGCLHQLLAAFSDIAWLQVAAIYVIGNVASLVSHVPGGLGVLEATVLFLLPQSAAAIGAVIAFRLVYFFVPLVIGVPLFIACEYFLREGARVSDQGAKEALEG